MQQAAVEYRLHIYRRTESSGEATRVADLPLQECSGTFLDQSFEWEQTYFYRAAVVAELAQWTRKCFENEKVKASTFGCPRWL